LSLQDVKEKLIPAALEIKGGEGIGFEEQTYAIIYEVAKINDPRTKDINGVPIYCAYVTDSSSEPAQLTSVKAIYPTRQGFFQLLNLIRSQELLDEFYNNDENWHENNPYLPEKLIKKINLPPTFKSLSLMILDREKNKDLTDEMRFSKHTIFTKHGSTVSSVQSFSPLWFFHNF